MKRNIILRNIAGLLLGLGLVACSQEQEPLQGNTATSTTPLKALHEEEVEELVTLSSSAYLQQADDELRAFPYNSTSEDYGHRWYNTSTKKTETEMVKKHKLTLDVASLGATVDVVVVLRNTQWPASRASLIFPMTWNKDSDRLTVQQKVTLPTGAGTSRWRTDGWRMLLFAGGKLDPETGVYSSERSESLPSAAAFGGKVPLNTIFVNKPSGNANDPWLPVNVTTSGTTTTFSVPNVVMQPQGSVLMLQVKNETPTRTVKDDRYFVNLLGFTVKSNVASLTATYSLLNLTTDAAPAYRGSEGGFSARFIKDGGRLEELRR